jgi:orotidine-5'-phosphate decarboxylase
MTALEVPESVRAQLAISLDVDDAVAALRLAKELQPWFGVAKVGLELYSAAGPDIVGALTDMGYEVFADLKFHDIPTTVGRAARVVGALGASYLNFHAAGGTAMLAAGVEGLVAGAEGAGLPAPVGLAVTVLTSEADAPHELLMARVRMGIEGGCGGVVCAATDVAAVKAESPDLVAVVPGIRPHGSPTNDQARMGTPAEAVAAGADILVIGRAVTASDDPPAAAASIAASLHG